MTVMMVVPGNLLVVILILFAVTGTRVLARIIMEMIISGIIKVKIDAKKINIVDVKTIYH